MPALASAPRPSAIEPGPEPGPGTPSFEVRRTEPLVSPLIFASPHAGRLYPRSLLEVSALDVMDIRRSEDALVDALIEGGAACGAALVLCRTARAWVDVNRDPDELDPDMFEGALPGAERAQPLSPRVAAGLGAIPRVVSEGREIYRGRLEVAEVERRLGAAHRPYHAAIAALMGEARTRFGAGVLIDWHSMPSAAGRTEARRGRVRADVVLGDRHGSSCGKALTRAARRAFEAAGYVVGLNSPYAGGWTTENHGRPSEGLHALQIEIDRALYLDEATLEPSSGFAGLKRDLERVFAELAAQDWASQLRA